MICVDGNRYKHASYGDYHIYGVPYIDNNVGLSEYLKKLKLDKNVKNILLLHTDYPGARDTDGREVDSVENLNVNTLNKFDLVLCGHIHKPQRLSKKVYMIGAPNHQRRTDRGCKLGYWEIYSDLSMKFIPLKEFPKFIDVEKEDDIKDDGNYYTVIPPKASNPVNNKHKITKQLSKKTLAKRYLKEKGIKDEVKTNLLIETLKKLNHVNISKYGCRGILFNRIPTFVIEYSMYHTNQSSEWQREIHYPFSFGMGNIWEESKGSF